MNKIFFISIFILILNLSINKMVLADKPEPIRYVALGDSYTIGTGVLKKEAWPYLLTRHLRAEGVDIQLVGNLAKNGYSTRDVLNTQLSVIPGLAPNFVTLLIGANDLFQGSRPQDFAIRLNDIFKAILQEVSADHFLVLTIPDFLVTGYGQRMSIGADFNDSFVQHNAIIKSTAKKYGVAVVDIYTVSQEMGKDPTLVAADQLHPSAKEHAIWEQQIFPVVFKLLKGKINQD